MGIRESLKEQPEQIRMQDISLENEPEEKKDQNLIFLDEQCKTIWQNIKMIFEGIETRYEENNMDLGDLEANFAFLKILFPEQIEYITKKYREYSQKESISAVTAIKEINKALDAFIEAETHNKDFQEIQKAFSKTIDLILLAGNFQIIFPNELGPETRQEIADAILRFKNYSASSRLNISSDMQFKLAVVYKIMLPEKDPVKDLDLDKKHHFERIKILAREIQSADLSQTQMLSDFAEFKMIFPNSFSELNISQNYFQKLRKQLLWFVQNDYQKKIYLGQEYLNYIYFFKIIVAKEAKITNNGLELIMPKKQDYKSKMPQRPERRNF